MRPLNRPMFRYGGPIKEGIMDGMQDRTIAGGNQMGTPMGNRTGFAKPSRSSFLKGLLQKAPGGQFVIDQTRGIIPRIFNKIKPTFRMQPGVVTGGTPGTRQKYISQTMPKVPFMEKAGAFVKENPYFTGITAPFITSGAVTATPPLVKGGLNLAEKGLLQATDLLVPDFIFDQDKFLADKKVAELNTQRQNLEKKKKELKEKETGDTVKKIDRDAEIQANRERYYKILGIDKMKKDSIYDSLIDASKIVTEEGGDLKGAIKSGTLQTRLIDAISKNLDKSADIKRQIDSAIVKAEIEKDINKDKNALDKLVKEKQLKALDLQLTGGSLQQILSDLQSKQGIVPEGPELAEIAIRKGIDIPSGHIFNSKDVASFLKDNPTLTVVDFVNDQNLKLQQAGKGSLTEGNFVVGNNIVTVGEDGTVTGVLV
jgi:hypothetical protein